MSQRQSLLIIFCFFDLTVLIPMKLIKLGSENNDVLYKFYKFLLEKMDKGISTNTCWMTEMACKHIPTKVGDITIIVDDEASIVNEYSRGNLSW